MENKETKSIRIQTKPSQNREHSNPLYLTSSFTFENTEQGRALFSDEIEGNIYTRFSNPNNTELVEKMICLENTEDGVDFASGMAAEFAAFGALLSTGDHILSSRSIFGSTHQILTKILPKWGISFTYFDVDKPDDWERLIRKNTKMLFVETPSNPGLDLIDLELVGDRKKKYNLILNVDNTFATPYLQTPVDFGADLITHSATKYIDGQGRVIGGIIVGEKKLIDEIRFFARRTGPCLSPFNAWILSKSLETLAVRMEKHCRNASFLAVKLHDHPELKNVKYPFLKSHPQYQLATKQMKRGGGIVTFSVNGGYERAKRFIDSIQMISITANLGDTRSIITHPSSTTHSKLSEEERVRVGIFPGLIRVSVGLENIEDILADITQALEKSK